MVYSDSRKVYLPYLYILPAVLIIVLLSFAPSIYSIILAMSQNELGSSVYHFVGFENFRSLLGDSYFWESFKNSVFYTIGSVSLTVTLGLILAVLFNQNPKFSSIYMVLIFIPWVLSEVVTGIIWRWLFNSQYGVIDIIFGVFGAKPSLWLEDTVKSMILMIIIGAWRSLPFSMLLLLAGLQSIPKELNECACIDGCNALKTFWYITLPLLGPTLGVVILLSTIGAMNTTGTFLAVTDGGPLRATETLSVYMYKEAFRNFHLSNSASISVSLLIINVILTIVYTRVMGKQEIG